MSEAVCSHSQTCIQDKVKSFQLCPSGHLHDYISDTRIGRAGPDLQFALALVLVDGGDGGLHGSAQLGEHEGHQLRHQGQRVRGGRAH